MRPICPYLTLGTSRPVAGTDRSSRRLGEGHPPHLAPASSGHPGRSRLAAALRNECAAFAEQCGIEADLNVSDLPRALPDDVSLCLLRVAQECLRNVAKHAQATEVRVALSCAIDGIALEIGDNGQGFNLESCRGRGGLGLISMEERARLAGGIFSIRSQSGKGTLTKVLVPLRQRIS